MINEWLNIIHKALYPPVCLICGNKGHELNDLCVDCAASLPYNRVCCRICAARLPESAGIDVCGTCSLKSPAYDSTCSMFLYQQPIRILISSLKFHSNHAAARLLGQLMSEHLRALNVVLPDLIIPVPLHPNRLKQRGFNQSIELARGISANLGVPMLLDRCLRNRDTVAQTGLVSKQRRKNMRGAFSMKGPLLENAQVAILDDVITTGSTVRELAKTLRRHGASKIQVWSIARANLEP